MSEINGEMKKEEKKEKEGDGRRNMNKKGMNKEECRGTKKLKERERDGELVLVESDKSGKVLAVDRKMYEEKMIECVEEDEEVEIERVEERKKEMSAMAIQMARMMRMGEELGQERRLESAQRSEASKIPVMDIMIKDHKDLSSKLHIRAVTKAILGDIVSNVLDKMADVLSKEEESECQSTGQMCIVQHDDGSQL